MWKRFDNIANQMNLVVFPRNNDFVRALRSKFAVKYQKYLCIADSYSKIKFLLYLFGVF